MVLSGLFARTPVSTVEESVMSQRWGQDGSTPFNFHVDTDANKTIHTVTAGKTLYINQILVNSVDAVGGGNVWKLRDGGGGGTLKLTHTKIGVLGDTFTITFSTPLTFSTDLALTDVSGPPNNKLTIVGWEE